MSKESSSGITLGAVIACILSWSVNHSVLWCIVHALLSWVYVVYYLFFHLK